MAHKRTYNVRMTLPEVHEKRCPIAETSASCKTNVAMTTHCSDSELPLNAKLIPVCKTVTCGSRVLEHASSGLREFIYCVENIFQDLL